MKLEQCGILWTDFYCKVIISLRNIRSRFINLYFCMWSISSPKISLFCLKLTESINVISWHTYLTLHSNINKQTLSCSLDFRTIPVIIIRNDDSSAANLDFLFEELESYFWIIDMIVYCDYPESFMAERCCQGKLYGICFFLSPC